MITEAEELIERGRAALAACDWAAARACFEQAVEGAESASALDGLGQALYWQGEYARALTLRERAYALFRRDDDRRRAGRLAVELAALQLWVHGNAAACSGWTAHARRLLEPEGDCVERGWLELLLAATAAADAHEGEQLARNAVELGRRFGDAGLEYDALGHVGLALVHQGHVAEGMRLVDEAVAAASSGVVADPWPAAEIYCTLFGACELVVDVPRAEAWLATVDGYVQRTGELPVSAICRMHYGGLLVSAGHWDDAERELVAALDLYERTWRGSRFEPVVRLADLRVRQGRLAEAGRLLEGFEGLPEAATALARVHLARDEAALAVRVIERRLSRRGRGLASVTLLGLLVEAMVADGRQDAAAEVVDELDGLARATGQPAVDGVASMAAARVAIATSDARAIEHLERALGAFAEARLPYELARTRLALAEALATADPELARAEARAAMTCFDELQAAPEADAAAALLRTLGERRRPRSTGSGTLTRREAEVLDRLARGRSNADIAADLHISPRTAEDHVSNILAKLGLANRTEAAAYALRSDVDRRRA